MPCKLPQKPISGQSKGFVRVFTVRDFNSLGSVLPDRIAPFRSGVDIAWTANFLKTSSYALMNVGFCGAGIRIDKFAREITGGPWVKDLNINLRENRADRSSSEYKLAVFKAIIGRLCDPELVLEDFSIDNFMVREGVPISDKALIAAEYIKFVNPDKNLIDMRAQYAGELACEIPGDPKDQVVIRNRWIFVAVSAGILYRDASDAPIREKFIEIALKNMHDDPSQVNKAQLWLKDQLRKKPKA